MRLNSLYTEKVLAAAETVITVQSKGAHFSTGTDIGLGFAFARLQSAVNAAYSLL